uniref:Uncharacterized protein n=1 Tax=Trypanosoma congolense (strain IL3000) TaxID=1068625 RepID=G0UVJ4_TRYCI|nr:conserved hypothetical protein [Trypanosoma congolense IL3000]
MSSRGKRSRWDEQGARYSDLDPAVKLQKRREERQEKKERERTLSYFTSMQRALEQQSSDTLGSLVDGFFVEVIKLLREDSSLHLLRNGTVCRTIEAALLNCELVHSKSLLYVLLGHVCNLATSPTASRTLEAVIGSIARGVRALSESDDELFATEMEEGGCGVNGVPSAATLVTCVVEELVEYAGDVVVHDIAARTVRTIVPFLAGFGVASGGVVMPPGGVRFTVQLDILGLALMDAVERVFSDGSVKSSVDVWLRVAAVPSASLIVQSLLRACKHGTRLDSSVRQRLEAVDDDNSTLFRRLLMDPLGCHLFQAYVKVPVPAPLLEAFDAAPSCQCLRGDVDLHACGKRPPGMPGDASLGSTSGVEGLAMERTCWDKALDVAVNALDELLDPTGGSCAHAAFALQDLVLYAPSALHLDCVWQQLLERIGLTVLLSSPKLAQVVAAFVRKCAFTSSVAAAKGDEGGFAAPVTVVGGFPGDVIPKDVEQAVLNDVAQGVRYFPTSMEFQKVVVTALCRVMRELCRKGAAQFLLVDGAVQDRGFEIARYMMHFAPSASAMFLHAVERLCLSDVEALLRHPKGSLVLQQFLRAGAAHHPMGKRGPDQQQPERTIPSCFLRRISPLLPQLVGNTYAAYAIEVLYDVSSLESKEELVKLLLPIYNGMKPGTEASCGEAGVVMDGADPTFLREFIMRKVMTKCCVEMYVHRPEDWMKLARRQCQVQRLLQRMSAVAL